MAAKRLRDERDGSPDGQEDKRLRKPPSFSKVIREVMLTMSQQKFCSALEQMLRRVVQEEVEISLLRQGALLLRRSPQRQHIQEAQQQPSALKLIFKMEPNLPIFTSNKIEDENGNCLQILLVDAQTGEIPPALQAIKVEIVVLNGDFPGNVDEWTDAEFNNNIIKEREGKRPLLVGDLNCVLRDGAASVDLSFTDNSSWTRSRHFRIGVRVAPRGYDGPPIKEAITKRFPVKDQRGETYSKHFPPHLGDQVWRLKKIRKDGPFHVKLSNENIITVQDFLKLAVVDRACLRGILGISMSEKTWEDILSHARTCEIGENRYLYRGQYLFTIIMNSICEVQGILQDGSVYGLDQIVPQQRAIAKFIAKEACFNWDKVEVAGGFNTAPFPTEPVPQGLIASSSGYTGNQEFSTSDVEIGLGDAQLENEVNFSWNDIAGNTQSR